MFISDYSRYTKPVDYNICPIKLEKGKTYTLSAELIGNKLSGQVVGITPYGSKYAEFRLIILIDTQGNTLKKTFTVDDTWTDPKLCVYGLTKQAFDNMFNNYNIQLEEGSTATSYVPHQEQNLPFSLKSKNLIDISTLQKGYVNINGTITVADSLDERYSEFIKVSPNTDYIFSIIETSSTYENWIGIGEYTSNNYTSFIRRDTMVIASQNYIQFTTSSTTEYIIVSARNLKEATKIQLEKGTSVTEYKQYYNYELNKIDTAKDKFIKENGKWYKHAEVLKIILDGTENYAKASEYTSSYGFALTSYKDIINKTISTISIFCNMLRPSNNNEASTTRIVMSNGNIVLNFAKDYVSYDVNALKTKITQLYNNGTPIIMYIPIATPTDTEITDTTLISQLEATLEAMSYYKQTNISSTSDEISAVIEANAVGDLNLILS